MSPAPAPGEYPFALLALSLIIMAILFVTVLGLKVALTTMSPTL